MAAPDIAAVEVRYPGNPFVVRADVFISSGGVYAYVLDDFQEKWVALQGVNTYEPVVHDKVLLVGSSSGLYGLRTDDGNMLWHVESSHEIFTPVVVDGIAYAGSRDGTLYAFNADNGREIWRHKFPGWVYSPAFVDNALITGGQDAKLWALDPSTGVQRWSRILPGELVFQTVAGAPKTVLATTFAADLIAIDTVNGVQRWRLQTPAANMTPAVSDARIFIVGLDSGLRQVNLDNGTVDWNTKLRGRLSLPFLTSHDEIIVSNDEGDVFVLNASNGIIIGHSRFTGEAVGAPFVRDGSVFQVLQNAGQLFIVAATEVSVD